MDKKLAELVSLITNFKDKKKLKVCNEFVSSGLKYHRYLDTNSHDVDRSIEGIQEKLFINSKCDEAEMFGEKILLFRSQVLNEDGFENSQMHYKCLHLLLNLARRPTTVSLSDLNLHTTLPQIEHDDGIDWRTLLKEDFVQFQFSDTSSEGELSDATSEHASTDASTHISTQNPIVEEPESDLEDSYDRQYWRTMRQSQIKNIMPAYWNTKKEYLVGESLVKKVDNSSLDPLQQHNSYHILSEYQIMRECIWLLSGSTRLFVFDLLQTGEFIVKPSVVLASLSHGSAHFLLNEFLVQARKLFVIREFVSRGLSKLTSTEQAFQSAINDHFLNEFDLSLVQLEHEVLLQNAPLTLLHIREKSKPWFDIIDIVYHVYVASSAGANPLAKANGILLSLESCILEIYDVCRPAKTYLILVKIWMDCCRPILNKLSWFYNYGVLIDDEMELPFISQIKALQWGSDCSNFTPNVPVLFSNVVQELFYGVKSIEFLSDLDKLFREELDFFSIFAHFKKSLEAFFQIHQPSLETSKFSSDHFEKFLTDCLPDLEGTNDLIKNHFLSLHQSLPNILIKSDVQKTFKSDVHLMSLLPLKEILDSCLFPFIRTQSSAVGSKAFELAQSNSSLSTFMSLLRNIYLCEAGDAIRDFCFPIFTELSQRKSLKKDTSFLTLLLRESFESRTSHDVDTLSVAFTPLPDIHQKVAFVGELLKISVDIQMPDILARIIQPEFFDLFNDVFRFILQIKFAKFTLDQLPLRIIYQFPDLSIRMKGIVLRLKMMHFVNSFEMYTMGIISQTNLHPQKSSIEDFVSNLSSSLSSLALRCFSGKKRTTFGDAILKILNLSAKFASRLRYSTDGISHEWLLKIERDFDKYVDLIELGLIKLVKRGSFPHLEMLQNLLGT